MKATSSINARNRGIVTGILGGAIGRSVSLLAPFMIMPAMLSELGEHLFGVWMTALALTSMALFIDFGIGNGLLTRLSTAYGRQDHDAMRRYIASAYVALSSIALVILMGLGVIYMITTKGWLPVNVPDAKTAGVVMVSLVTFVLGIPASIIQRVMYAHQQAWLSHMWQIGGAALSVILALLAIHYQLPAWQIIAAYSAPAVIILLISTVFFFYRHALLRPQINDISKQSALDLLKIGSKFLALSVLTSCALNVDNILISYQLGAAAVTEYAVPAKIASLLGLVVSTIFLPLWAANGEALARRDYNWVRHTTKKMTMLGAGAVAGLGLIMVLCSNWLIQFWMGRQFQWQTETLIGLSCLSFCMALSSPCQMLLNSMGEIKIQIKIWGIFLFISVLLKFYFLDLYDFWVVPIVTSLLYFLIIVPVVYLRAQKLMKQHEEV